MQKIIYRDLHDSLVHRPNMILWRIAAPEEGNPSQGMESKTQASWLCKPKTSIC
jgi:hypothetical protein